MGGDDSVVGLDVDALTLLESLPDVVWVIDSDGRVVWTNGRGRAVTGYDGDLIGIEVDELLVATQPEEARTAFTDIEGGTDGSSAESFVFDIVSMDGERWTHEFNVTPFEFDGDSFYIGIARDITARREREHEIRRQRDELKTLNNVSETVHEVIQAVVGAASRDEIEQVVCEKLATSGLFVAVWIGRLDPEGDVTPVAGVGRDEAFMQKVSMISELDWERPAEVALETGEKQVVQQVSKAEAPDIAKEMAAELGVRSGMSVPIIHGNNVLGVLSLYSGSPDAFNERVQAAFRRLSEVIGFAIRARQAERILLSDTVTQLTFRVTAPDGYLAPLSLDAEGPLRLEWSTPDEKGTNRYRHYITAVGLDPNRAVELAREREHIESVEHIGDNSDGKVLEIITNDSLTQRLFDVGATPASVVAEDGETTIVAEVSDDADSREVAEAVKGLFETAELVSKRDRDRPIPTTDEFYDAVDDGLTDRQRSALKHAFFGGYFSWPRDATAEDIAESMDISSPTFHYHIRHAQHALTEAYLEHLED